MVLKLFKSNKWKHQSTTVEMKDEERVSTNNTDIPPPVPPKNNNTVPNHPPTVTKTNPTKKPTKIPFNSDSLLNGIGDYIFHSSLGGGKFSKVMLATHYLTGNKVAIKIINKRAYLYRVMSRLVREINIMEVLDHENIVKLYETYETADTLYLVMEYVEGYNLEEYLKKLDRGMIPEHEARDIFRQVIKAVDHCHSKWIVHRDLKTPNILLTKKDHKVKIADFGLGNRFGLQRLKTVCGSMLYYSPEIISAKPYFGPEVDTWCLGIMLFRMTAGVELFSHAKNFSELKKYVTSRNYKFPPHLSPELQSTIQKCLSNDRYDRLSLHTLLSTDPWFNDFGRLENIFEERRLGYHQGIEATDHYIDSIKSEDTHRIKHSMQHSKIQCKQDLQQERKLGHTVPKVVIYHPFHPSTYYTGPAPHSSANPIDIEAQSQVMIELNDQLIHTLRQVKLQPTQLNPLKSPIHHFIKKFKTTTDPLRKSSSALSLSQLYQRMTKDHTRYYSIQPTVHADSGTTCVEPFLHKKVSDRRLSKRLSVMFFSQPEFNLKPEDHGPIEFLKLIRLACEMLGISFYQTQPNQLICLLTLRNCPVKVHQPTLHHATSFASARQASISSSTSSTSSQNWFSRQVQKFSFNPSQSIMHSTGFVLGNSSHDLLSIGRMNPVKSNEETEEDEGVNPEAYALLSIDTFVPNHHDPLVAIRYSKIKGSSRVFKLAKGWIQTLLAQESIQEQSDPLDDYHPPIFHNEPISS